MSCAAPPLDVPADGYVELARSLAPYLLPLALYIAGPSLLQALLVFIEFTFSSPKKIEVKLTADEAAESLGRVMEDGTKRHVDAKKVRRMLC
jgi:hypothetical protein